MKLLKPSQWVNFPWFIIAAGSGYLFFSTSIDEYGLFDVTQAHWIFVVPIIWWLWKYLVINCWNFYMDERSETIIEKKCVF